jgi:hypothetical protein
MAFTPTPSLESAMAALATAAEPPAMAAIKNKTTEEVVADLNRVPLFMTMLDETDGTGGENVALEAIKAIAYEGSRSEVAGNFREQGNECARIKRWADAKEYYGKALDALTAKEWPNVPDEDDEDYVAVDEDEERSKERKLEETCYVNRALCHLELSKCCCCCCSFFLAFLFPAVKTLPCPHATSS